MAKIDLTEGNIVSKLFKLTMPIVLTGFMETTYNLVDMFWIGKLGTGELAAIGTAGFYIWLSAAFIFLVRTGTEIFVAQKTGEQDHEGAKEYARTGILLSFVIGFLFSLIMIVFRVPLITLFNIDDAKVVNDAILYLIFVTPGIFISFISKVMTGAFNGRGKSHIPFAANVFGLVVNIILDPILIFGYFGLPAFGVVGAALATTFAQLVSLIVFIYYIKIKKSLFDTFKLFKRIKFDKIVSIIKLGIPTCIYNGLFTTIAIIVSIIIASYGKEAIAAQKVGSQIESISWMTASGFATAMATFVGQNVGARKYDRVVYGYKEALKISTILGLINTFILFVFSSGLMYLFFATDTITQGIGVDYLKIIAYSQVFMCIEITTTGAFNGLGNTKLPAYTNTFLNLLRIPLAMVLSYLIGLNGVWYAITISSLLKGVVMLIFFYIYIKRSDEYSIYLDKKHS